jgi:fatty-acyl-CoA synthase
MIIGTGGAATSTHLKDGILKYLPNVAIRDGYGASETGGMAFGDHKAGLERASFSPGAGAAVVSEDRNSFLAAGEEELGWIARRGRVPIGYLNDEERTRATFPEV